MHSDPGGVGAFDVKLGPRSLHLDVCLFVCQCRPQPAGWPAEQGVAFGGGQGVTCIPFGAPHAAQAVEVAAASSEAHSSVQ